MRRYGIEMSTSAGASEPPSTPASIIGPRVAAALVFLASAAVLVVELVALRLLAPYFGLSLETSTLVIGVALAAIAFGSWWGGRAADLLDPQCAIGPLLAISGVVVAATPAMVRTVAESAPPLLFLTSAATILVPGALLSAVTPMVTKLRLTTLAETGTVVGRLSGVGTLGAIVGTVITGFVLISRVPVSAILIGLGGALILLSFVWALSVRRGRFTIGAAALTLAPFLLGAGGMAVAPGGCDVETTYHCAVVEQDPERENGRILVLDAVRHSYVDLEDPTYLGFPYVRGIVAVVDSNFTAGAELDAYHLGGGGLTVPRYLSATRPGTNSVVSEIDPGVVEIDEELLDSGEIDGVEVRVEDGRLGMERLETDSRDLVVGDAFGGVSVPWHLTTTEALTEIRRVLKDDGIYIANVLDYRDLAFARAEVATLNEVFAHVAVAGKVSDLAEPSRTKPGGNLLLIASDQPIPVERTRDAVEDEVEGWTLLEEEALERWVGDAQVLTDNYAPVDQLADQPTAS